MNQTAIVFGASGLVGRELIFELLEDKRFLNVKAVVRNPLPFSNPKLEQLLIKDFDALDSLSGQLSADTYFCCIGTTIKKAGSQEAFTKTDLGIPLKIATFAQTLQVPHLILISSLGASATSSTFYLRTKGLMEQQVQACYKGNLKIVRPSLILGNRHEFRLGEKVIQMVGRVVGVVMIGPMLRYKGIKAWDIARGMIKSIELPKEKVILESEEIRELALQLKPKPTNEHEIIK
jgi:uncharacterized protein YbjT (DUF2867 family)